MKKMIIEVADYVAAQARMCEQMAELFSDDAAATKKEAMSEAKIFKAKATRWSKKLRMIAEQADYERVLGKLETSRGELKEAKSWINILLNIDNNPSGEHSHIRACASEFFQRTG